MVCNVAASAGTFTIPPYALLALPAGNIDNSLQFQQQTKGVFTAKGLMIGAMQTSNAATVVGGFTLK